MAFLAGGLLNRWRGGWLPWPKSHNLRRLGLTLGLSLVAYVTFGDWRVALGALLLFPGLLPAWGQWFDMGRMGGELKDDLMGLTGRGLVLTAPFGSVVCLLGHGPWVTLSGAAMGIIYAGAWWLGDRVRLDRWQFLDGPTSAAEFLFMGLVFTVTVWSLNAA